MEFHLQINLKRSLELSGKAGTEPVLCFSKKDLGRKNYIKYELCSGMACVELPDMTLISFSVAAMCVYVDGQK